MSQPLPTWPTTRLVELSFLIAYLEDAGYNSIRVCLDDEGQGWMTRDAKGALEAIDNDPQRFRYVAFYNESKSIAGEQASIVLGLSGRSVGAMIHYRSTNCSDADEDLEAMLRRLNDDLGTPPPHL
jgi:hypothetical protein